MKTAILAVALCCAVAAHAAGPRVLPNTPSAPTNPTPQPGTMCGTPVCIIPVVLKR